MSTEVRWRRGTTAQHASFTGALAEVTVDTDKKTLVVHDGSTAGGFPLPTATEARGVALQARVSLVADRVITESDISGATTVYVVPAGHSNVVIYDGSADSFRTFGSLSLTLDSTNAPSGKNFDVWLAYSGGNVVCGYGPDWTAGASAGSNTARGTGTGSTELELFNGRLVNKNAITLRNSNSTTYSVPARQATLAGGFRTSGAGITEDSASKRLVWSVLSAPRTGEVIDTTGTWSYGTATFRAFNGAASNKFAYFQGLGGGILTADVTACGGVTSGSGNGTVGIGIDSSSANSATRFSVLTFADVRSEYIFASYKGSPGIGYHEVWPLEKGDGSSTINWLGSPSGVLQTGMTCEVQL